MANGWTHDGAVQEQIDSSVADALERIRSRLPSGESLSHCEECDAEIPAGRREAIPGVRLCVNCQAARDEEENGFSSYNRRASKDSQLR